MAVNSELAKTVVVATLALAPVLAGSSAAQQAARDNPPPGITVSQDAQAPGSAGQKPEVLSDKPLPNKSSKKGDKYDIAAVGRRELVRGLNRYSIEQEEKLGRRLAAEIEAQVTLVNDPADSGKDSMLSRAFMSHPTTADHIPRAQKAIATYLPSRDLYIVNTSSFDEAKSQLASLGLGDAAGPLGRPVLRRCADASCKPEAQGGTQ